MVQNKRKNKNKKKMEKKHLRLMKKEKIIHFFPLEFHLVIKSID